MRAEHEKLPVAAQSNSYMNRNASSMRSLTLRIYRAPNAIRLHTELGPDISDDLLLLPAEE